MYFKLPNYCKEILSPLSNWLHTDSTELISKTVTWDILNPRDLQSSWSLCIQESSLTVFTRAFHCSRADKWLHRSCWISAGPQHTKAVICWTPPRRHVRLQHPASRCKSWHCSQTCKISFQSRCEERNAAEVGDDTRSSKCEKGFRRCGSWLLQP